VSHTRTLPSSLWNSGTSTAASLLLSGWCGCCAGGCACSRCTISCMLLAFARCRRVVTPIPLVDAVVLVVPLNTRWSLAGRQLSMQHSASRAIANHRCSVCAAVNQRSAVDINTHTHGGGECVERNWQFLDMLTGLKAPTLGHLLRQHLTHLTFNTREHDCCV
jgi:hypothetical protein